MDRTDITGRLADVARALAAYPDDRIPPIQRERLASVWGCSAATIQRDIRQIRNGRSVPEMGELRALPMAPLPPPAEKPPAGFGDMEHGDVLVWVMEELGSVARHAEADGPRVTALKELRVTSRERHEWVRANTGRPVAAEDAAAARERVEAMIKRLPAKAREAAMAKLTGTG